MCRDSELRFAMGMGELSPQLALMVCCLKYKQRS